MKTTFARIARFLLLLIFLALGIAVTWGISWVIKVESFPTPVIPTPKMPPNNAFDTFRAAHALMVKPDDVHAAASLKSPFTLSQKEALLAANTAALARLKLGLAEPYYNPPARRADQNVSYYWDFRELAMLLSLESQIEEAKGKWQSGAESDLDAIQMGAMIPNGSTLGGRLFGIAYQTIGRRPLWPCIDHLTAEQARDDIKRLLQIQAGEANLAEVLQQEEWTVQAILLNVGKERDFQESWTATLIQRTGLYNYTSYINQLITISRLPYRREMVLPKPPRDLLGSVFANPMGLMFFRDTENQAQNHLLLIALALHAYKLDHGSYPDTLDQLAPAYLATVPTDPFGFNAPLRYRRDGSAYILYSIGPDGKDDGGKAILNTSSHYSERFKKMIADKPSRFVELDSKGDIVAGVNF